ncbi:MAG: hypothetical protein P8X57_15440 [Cyclobacteriaceae bacterium]
MYIVLKTAPPKFNIFLSYLGICSVAGIAIAIPIVALSSDITVSTIVILLFWPLAAAAALTYSSRRFAVRIDEVGNMDKVNDYIMDYLVSEELMTVSEDAGGIWMESTKAWNRWFQHWFGTERIRIVRTPLYIQVSGHRKYIEGLESKLRYGR